MRKSQSRNGDAKSRLNDIVHVNEVTFLEDLTVRLDLPSVPSESPFDFKRRYLLSEIMTKFYDDRLSKKDKAERTEFLRNAAFNSFNEGESSCHILNQKGIIDEPQLVELARIYVDIILGEFSYAKVLKGVAHGSGATARRSRGFGSPSYKYDDSVDGHKYFSSEKRRWIHHDGFITCTPLAYKYAAALCDLTRLGNKNNIFLVRGNTLDTVRKNNKTDRMIAKEPDLNMFLQKGVGSYMARRLSLFNNSKYDQSRNQKLAKIGSIDGSLATIDLSKASDSLSYALVSKLLSPSWLEYLDAIRSHYYKDDDGAFKPYSKFCTMGNGFCFELQTIIFLAITLAASGRSLKDVGHTVSTYGDDIICPSSEALNVINLLRICGFTPNESKTFYSGAFRESCGKHYYNGVDVTPFYIRKPINCISRFCWLLNNIRKWSYCELAGVCDDTLYPLWLDLYKSVPLAKYLSGGRDCDRIDYIVSPGRPKRRLSVKTTRIMLPEYGTYTASISQGLYAKPLKIAHYDDSGNEYEISLSHISIHPESDSISEFRLISNSDERHLIPSEFKFLTEL